MDADSVASLRTPKIEPKEEHKATDPVPDRQVDDGDTATANQDEEGPDRQVNDGAIATAVPDDEDEDEIAAAVQDGQWNLIAATQPRHPNPN